MLLAASVPSQFVGVGFVGFLNLEFVATVGVEFRDFFGGKFAIKKERWGGIEKKTNTFEKN